jgi:rhodanese-related sulfurtransferase
MLFISCSPVKNLNPDGISRLISSGDENLIIIDLRSANDFTDGHIKGALNIPFSEETFGGRIKSINNSNKSAVFYCGKGIKTEKAMPFLKKSAFRKAYILEGGFEAWKNRGLEIVH